MTFYACPQCFEKQREIDRLTEENERLRQKLSKEERKNQEGFFGLSTPPSKVPVKANTPKDQKKKMGGRKPGHPGAGRKSFTEAEADSIKEIPYPWDTCPDCHNHLTERDDADRSVLDIEPVRTRKILLKLQVKECKRCHRLFSAQAPGALPNYLLGNELLTYVAVSHYQYGIPLGRILKQLKLKRSAITHAMHRLAKLFEGIVERLIEEYRKSAVKHADETGWRNDGQSGYAWVFCTIEIAIFMCRDTRSSQVPLEVFGKEKNPGVLVTDRYRAYNFIDCLKQYCLEHLKRDTDKAQKEFSDSKEVETFTSHFRGLLTQAIKLRGEPISDDQYYERARKLKQEIQAAAHQPQQHLAIRYLQDIFTENEDALYQWVEDRSVPADNNFAERTIRFLAIARKVSFGSQSEQGAKTRSVLMTILHTMELRGIDVAATFKKALDTIAQNPDADPYTLLFGEKEEAKTSAKTPVVATKSPLPPQKNKVPRDNQRPPLMQTYMKPPNITPVGPAPPIQ